MNRLGIAQPTVKSFLHDEKPEKTTEDLEAELMQIEEQQKLAAQRKAEIEELCPECKSSNFHQAIGSRRFYCLDCKRTFKLVDVEVSVNGGETKDKGKGI
jgi:transposase-like protein